VIVYPHYIRNRSQWNAMWRDKQPHGYSRPIIFRSYFRLQQADHISIYFGLQQVDHILILLRVTAGRSYFGL